MCEGVGAGVDVCLNTSSSPDLRELFHYHSSSAQDNTRFCNETPDWGNLKRSESNRRFQCNHRGVSTKIGKRVEYFFFAVKFNPDKPKFNVTRYYPGQKNWDSRACMPNYRRMIREQACSVWWRETFLSQWHQYFMYTMFVLCWNMPVLCGTALSGKRTRCPWNGNRPVLRVVFSKLTGLHQRGTFLTARLAST